MTTASDSSCGGPTVVLHADDFGLNRAVTDGIVDGFRRGLLTATSLLANAPDATRALDAWRSLLAERTQGRLPSRNFRRVLDDAHRPFELGVHLNLTQGRPLTGRRYPPALLDREGRFPGIGSLFRRSLRLDATMRSAIRRELDEQIAFVIAHGFQPTHLNGHQYVELLPPVRAAIPDLLRRFEIPAVRVAVEPGLPGSTLRHEFRPANAALAAIKRGFGVRFRDELRRAGIAGTDAFFGTSHAGRIDLRLLRRFLSCAAKKRFATIEIGLHPGRAAVEDDASRAVAQDGWTDPLASRRPQELDWLTSPELARLFLARRLRLGRLAPLWVTRSASHEPAVRTFASASGPIPIDAAG